MARSRVVIDCATRLVQTVAYTGAEEAAADADAATRATAVTAATAAAVQRAQDVTTVKASATPEVQALVRLIGLG